jgi:hypothetical protein
MKLKGAVLLTVFAIVAVAAFVLNYAMTEAGGTTASPSGGLEIGATVENFSLTDTDGAAKSLNDLKGKNGTLVVWLSAQCPVVKAYKDRINEVAAEYQSKGIAFIGINSNSTEDLNWVNRTRPSSATISRSSSTRATFSPINGARPLRRKSITSIRKMFSVITVPSTTTAAAGT